MTTFSTSFLGSLDSRNLSEHTVSCRWHDKELLFLSAWRINLEIAFLLSVLAVGLAYCPDNSFSTIKMVA